MLDSDKYDSYCGTSYAAKMLNLSVGTIHGLVDSNALRAWKTQGGHRRISMNSIQEYMLSNNLGLPKLRIGERRLRVLVVEDDHNTRVMYQAHFDRWDLSVDVVMYSSAIEALLDMPTMDPHVLLTDLNMPSMNGFEFLKTLREHKLFASLPIIAITGLSKQDIELRGGLPKEVQVLHKPVDMEWLRGFFEALIAMQKIKLSTS